MQFVLSAYPEKCLGVDQYSELGSVVLAGGQKELTPGIGRRLETMTCWLPQKVYSQGRPGQVRMLGRRHCQEQWTREQRRLGWGAERAEQTPQLALLALPSDKEKWRYSSIGGTKCQRWYRHVSIHHGTETTMDHDKHTQPVYEISNRSCFSQDREGTW